MPVFGPRFFILTLALKIESGSDLQIVGLITEVNQVEEGVVVPAAVRHVAATLLVDLSFVPRDVLLAIPITSSGGAARKTIWGFLWAGYKRGNRDISRLNYICMNIEVSILTDEAIA